MHLIVGGGGGKGGNINGNLNNWKVETMHEAMENHSSLESTSYVKLLGFLVTSESSEQIS